MGGYCCTSPPRHTTVLAFILLMSTCGAFELSRTFHCANQQTKQHELQSDSLQQKARNSGFACHCAGRYFTSNPPARACFAVKSLPLGAKVEIEAIAAL